MAKQISFANAVNGWASKLLAGESHEGYFLTNREISTHRAQVMEFDALVITQ